MTQRETRQKEQEQEKEKEHRPKGRPDSTTSPSEILSMLRQGSNSDLINQSLLQPQCYAETTTSFGTWSTVKNYDQVIVSFLWLSWPLVESNESKFDLKKCVVMIRPDSDSTRLQPTEPLGTRGSVTDCSVRMVGVKFWRAWTALAERTNDHMGVFNLLAPTQSVLARRIHIPLPGVVE